MIRMTLQTFNKNVKFRRERNNILICDCKNLKDFKLRAKFHNFLEKIKQGISETAISDRSEQLLFKDFLSSDLLAKLTIKTLSENDYSSADELLERELYHGRRPRTLEFLMKKLHEHPGLFLGLYLDDELIGVVQGFPRDDYLLMSEIAVDIRFRGRNFGTLLIKSFEDAANKHGYKKIKLGAQDKAVKLYLKNNYVPSMFIQVFDDKADDALKKIKSKIIEITKSGGMTGIEIPMDKIDMKELDSIKRKFSPVSAQYLFTKIL